jgi:hypothetical protein
MDAIQFHADLFISDLKPLSLLRNGHISGTLLLTNAMTQMIFWPRNYILSDRLIKCYIIFVLLIV